MATKQTKNLFVVLLCLGLYNCSKPPPVVHEETPETFPMEDVSLDDLSAFNQPGKNWSIAGDALASTEKKGDLQPKEGTGVLINLPSEENRDNLFTNFEHGDIELEIGFMMPKGSNSGIYLQGRYEVQLLDSWLEKQPQHSDCGGIYQRWDESRPDGQKGYEGVPPASNASKAPGLWQHYKIYFRAPRFDANGNKTENARFVHVYHNGFLIHENVEVTGPTRAAAFEDEQPLGPLMIQGDHGPVAFRNIKYKPYTLDSLSLTDLTYQVYEGKFGEVPNFDTLQAVSSGSSQTLDVNTITDLTNDFGVLFNGKLSVPKTGDYLWEAYADDGGAIFIDGVNIDPDADRWINSMVTFQQGTYDFKMGYIQRGGRAETWVSYEGQSIQRQRLAEAKRKDVSSGDREEVIVQVGQYPEMVRGFVEHGDGPKETHAISVGDPLGVNYSYNLQSGGLLKAWRGAFANTTEMWVGRGGSQLLRPANAAIETSDGPQAAVLENKDANWPDTTATDFRAKGYRMTETDHPVIEYSLGSIQISDATVPSTDSVFLTRTVTASGEGPVEGLWFMLAKGKTIDDLGEDMYRIDGMYYLRLEGPSKGTAYLRPSGELMAPFSGDENSSVVHYTIIW